MATSKSRITNVINFDIWTSGNQLDVLGIIARYINGDYKVRNVLLALRNTHGSHISKKLNYHLLAVLYEYEIDYKVSYFMAANASNNDNAL